MHKIISSIIICFASTHLVQASTSELKTSLDATVVQIVLAYERVGAILDHAWPNGNKSKLGFKFKDDDQLNDNKKFLIQELRRIDPAFRIRNNEIKAGKTELWCVVSNPQIGLRLCQVYHWNTYKYLAQMELDKSNTPVEDAYLDEELY